MPGEPVPEAAKSSVELEAIRQCLASAALDDCTSDRRAQSGLTKNARIRATGWGPGVVASGPLIAAEKGLSRLHPPHPTICSYLGNEVVSSRMSSVQSSAAERRLDLHVRIVAPAQPAHGFANQPLQRRCIVESRFAQREGQELIVTDAIHGASRGSAGCR
jgi:hypothetical protein